MDYYSYSALRDDIAECDKMAWRALVFAVVAIIISTINAITIVLMLRGH